MTRNRCFAAALGVVCIVGLVADRSSVFRLRNARPEVSELARAIGSYRTIEPRLTGGFIFGPLRGQIRSSAVRQDVSPDVRIAIAQIEKRAARSTSAADWAALGTSYLVTGDLEKGVEFLEAAVASEAPDARWLSDLAAGYLALAEQRRRPDLVPRALSAADRACRLDGRLAEAAFNRALALEAVHLTDQATTAWLQYRRLDPDSAWSDEALAHLSKLEEISARDAQRRKATGDLVASIADGAKVDDELARPIRESMRMALEIELIPLWAEAELSRDRAEAMRHLARARRVADALAAAGGDPMPSDGVASIERSYRSSIDKRLTGALARSHLAFRDILRQFDAGQVDLAHQTFQSAEPGFAAAGSPYQYWRSIYGAVSAFANRRFDTARERLAADDRHGIGRRYRYLAGRKSWIQGLILGNTGHFMAAQPHYETALSNCDAVGEEQSALALRAVLAENLSRLGIPVEAWRHELDALARVGLAGPGRRQHLILQIASGLALSGQQPWAALYFQHSSISLASSPGTQDATDLSDSYLSRAQVLARLGDSRSARDDLARATAVLRDIDVESLRQLQEAEIFAAQGEVDAQLRPGAAVGASTKAIEFFGDSAGEARMIGLYVARARALLVDGQHDRAESDLIAAINQFETQRSRLTDRQLRMAAFRGGWSAYAEMVRFQAVVRHDAGAALDYAERGRARTLLEAVSNTVSVEPVPIAHVRQQLPEDTAAIFFVTLEDRLLAWTVRRRAVSMTDQVLTSAVLRADIDRLRWLMRQQSSDTDRVRLQLEELFDRLVAPMTTSLQGVRRLVVVPDGPLHAVPFAALRNRATRHYLIEDYSVTVAASLSTMIRPGRAPLRRSARERQALVIGNPSRGHAVEDVLLPPLPFSEVEAQRVAALYGTHLLLTNSAATKRSFLENLPKYEIVHYAGHALVNEPEPSLSRLFLANDVTTGDDGTLSMSELANLKLDRTELVVLGACSTGTGGVTNGEGLLSIARPFLESGAATVVATLWDIADDTAEEFFLEFHRQIASGETPANALTLTQRSFITSTDGSRHAPGQWAWAISVGALP